MANTPPRPAIIARDEGLHARNARHGRRQAANTSAAKKMRSQATPWKAPEDAVQSLAPVVLDAADLIASDHERLRYCPACDWLFEDQTRNGQRRWCDMADCGCRDKARRYYRRVQKAGRRRRKPSIAGRLKRRPPRRFLQPRRD
jgi:predicted RNA-binding Zn ribbon-like protein